MRVLLRAVVGCLLLTPCSVHGQDLEHRGSPFAWQYSLASPAGSLRGVIASERGEPLLDAIVSLSGTPRERPMIQVDSLGRFEFTGLAPGSWELQVSSMRAGISRLALIVPADMGITLRAVLADMGPIGGRCGDMVNRGDDVSVQVVDSLTGRHLSGPMAIRLLRDTVLAQRAVELPPAGNEGSYWLLSVPYRVEAPGRYDIEVEVPGYRLWRMEAVDLDVEYAVCSRTARNRHHTARMVPLPW